MGRGCSSISLEFMGSSFKFISWLGLWLLLLPVLGLAQADSKIQQLYGEAKSAEQQGDLNGAIQKYQEILKVDPRMAVVYNNIGRLYHQQSRLDDAIQALRRACELDPKLAPSHALLGFSYYQLGDYGNARKALQTAARLNPADTNVKLYLARSLVELNDLKGALKILEPLQQQDPKNTEVLYSLGLVYSGLSESTIGQIQKVDPNSYLIELLLGKFSEIKQVYPDAVEHYRRAIERAPENADLYYRYAHALWANGDFDKSLAQYREALKMNPYDYRSAWEAARIVLNENPEEALALCNRALTVKPDVGSALAIRGRALLALGKPQDAVADFKQANTLDPEDASIHFQLARAYRQLGLTQEAQNETAIYERMDKEAHTPKAQPAVPR